MFSEKGFSKEQTDLFLKKVNFMENREYFFHKRRVMNSREDQENNYDKKQEDTSQEANKTENKKKSDKYMK